MERLQKENLDIMNQSDTQDVNARERARANYNRAVEIQTDVEDLCVSDDFNSSIYQVRGVNIVIEMDNNLKDRRWANTE